MSKSNGNVNSLKSLSHFRSWASELILDDGEPWELEDFQIEVVKDVLSGFTEIWMVVPEANGKTTLAAGIALYLCEHTTSAFIPIGASSREQAEIMYRQAEGFVVRTPGMPQRFRCYEGYRRVKCHDTAGRIQIYAADDRTADGIIPSAAILDELHRHRNLRLYRTWRGKLSKRPGAQLLAISTAGEPGSEFEEVRERILKTASEQARRGAHVRAEGKGVVLHDWAVREREKAFDMKVVAKANPRKHITPESLQDKYESESMTQEHWLRFNCNIATKEEGQAITQEEWDALYEKDLEPDPNAWCVGFLDLGWKVDTTAMGIYVWESQERRCVTDVRVFHPPVDESDVVAGLVDLQEKWGPVGWAFDPNAGGRQMAQQLEKGEHPHQGDTRFKFIEHSQDNAPMALAAERLEEAVRSGWLRHDGDEELRRHVLNAVRVPLPGEKRRFDRPTDAKTMSRRQRFPIDALTGLLMGNSVAVAEKDKPPAVPLVAYA